MATQTLLISVPPQVHCVPASAIGERVRELRMAHGLSQADLALRLGWPQQHVSRIERGVRTPMNGTREKLAAALGVPVEFLGPAPSPQTNGQRGTCTGKPRPRWHTHPSLLAETKLKGQTPVRGTLDGAALERQAQSEAAFFAGLVRAGRITAQVALETIGVDEEVRDRLLEFAAAHPGADAKMVRSALRLRDAALAEFHRLLSVNQQPAT